MVNPLVVCLPEPSVEVTGCGSSLVTSAFRTEGVRQGWDQALQSPFNRKEQSFQEPPAFCRQAAYILKFSLSFWKDWTQYISFVLLKIRVSNFYFTVETLKREQDITCQKYVKKERKTENNETNSLFFM